MSKADLWRKVRQAWQARREAELAYGETDSHTAWLFLIRAAREFAEARRAYFKSFDAEWPLGYHLR